MWTAAGLFCLALAALGFVRLVRSARKDMSSATMSELVFEHVGNYVLFFAPLIAGALLLGWPGR